MTAIAWKDGVLATDSRCTAGSGLITDETNKKIYKYKNFVLAACGNEAICAWYYMWLKSDFRAPPQHATDMDNEAFLVDTEEQKLFKVFSNGAREEVPVNKPIATGSAGAMVQMLMREFDIDPVKAIKIVAKYDATINSRVKKVKCW